MWHTLWRGPAYVLGIFLTIFRPLVTRLAPSPSLVDVSTEKESQKACPNPTLYFVLTGPILSSFKLTLVLSSVPLLFLQETETPLSHA